MIPKIIHYCWFGKGEKNETIKKCIASWYKYCPDWEIVEWNESNYDVNKIVYMKEAYEEKKWAYVSDVARLDILYNHGGVYLDTDVELFSNLEDWLQYSAVFAFETGRCINSGSGFAALKDSKVVLEMLKYYEECHFIIKGKMNLLPCPAPNTEALCRGCREFRRNGKTQIVDNIKVLSGVEYSLIAKHHYTGGANKAKENVRVYHNSKWKNFMRNPKIFIFIEKYLGRNILRGYTFFVYDLQEYGLLYFLKRKFRK